LIYCRVHSVYTVNHFVSLCARSSFHSVRGPRLLLLALTFPTLAPPHPFSHRVSNASPVLPNRPCSLPPLREGLIRDEEEAGGIREKRVLPLISQGRFPLSPCASRALRYFPLSPYTSRALRYCTHNGSEEEETCHCTSRAYVLHTHSVHPPPPLYPDKTFLLSSPLLLLLRPSGQHSFFARESKREPVQALRNALCVCVYIYIHVHRVYILMPCV